MINIELICKPRGNGKTYDLIMKSAETGIPILTAFDPRYIVGEANRLGVKIPEPMSISRYKRLKDVNGFGDKWDGRLLIDEVDCVLNRLLDAEVDTVTLTPDSLNNFKIEVRTVEEIHNLAMKNIENFENEYMGIYKEEENNMTTKNNVFENLALNGNYERIFCGDTNSFIGFSLSRIRDVNIIVPKKVVEVTFADGTKQKSVCQEPDVFSLETAISICLLKKIMGGSSAYNNAVKRGVKVYENKLKKIEEDKAEQERIAKKRTKREAYKARRVAKREATEKEKAIAIQTEAYIRAMEEMENRKNDKSICIAYE